MLDRVAPPPSPQPRAQERQADAAPQMPAAPRQGERAHRLPPPLPQRRASGGHEAERRLYKDDDALALQVLPSAGLRPHQRPGLAHDRANAAASGVLLQPSRPPPLPGGMSAVVEAAAQAAALPTSPPPEAPRLSAGAPRRDGENASSGAQSEGGGEASASTIALPPHHVPETDAGAPPRGGANVSAGAASAGRGEATVSAPAPPVLAPGIDASAPPKGGGNVPGGDNVSGGGNVSGSDGASDADAPRDNASSGASPAASGEAAPTPAANAGVAEGGRPAAHATLALAGAGMSDRGEAALLVESFAKDIQSKDVVSLKVHLRQMEIVLVRDSLAFRANDAVVPMPAGLVRKASPVARPLPSAEGSANVTRSWTLLAAAAGVGWAEGVAAMLTWAAGRVDGGEPMDIDAPSGNYTPLSLAVEANAAEAVALLLRRGASAAVRDDRGLTPLEAAVLAGPGVLEALLDTEGSKVAHGLLDIRLKVRKAQEKAAARYFEQNGLFSGMEADFQKEAQAKVPHEFRPPASDMPVVGEDPSMWVSWYKAQVMHTFAKNTHVMSRPGRRAVEALLRQHGFDEFARGAHATMVFVISVLGLFGLGVHVVFRLRVFGGLEAPASVADGLLGAFDPARLADPDFDPSRQMAKLPYRDVRMLVNHQEPSAISAMHAFWKALISIHHAWLLQSVRIPPERDPYDEDYLSDDDEDCRQRVRLHCVARAHKVRRNEVLARLAIFWGVLFWLGCEAGHWHDVLLLLGMFLTDALLASTVASFTRPRSLPEEPEKVDAACGKVDAAVLVSALFGPQHGPRWARAICTTRSTATKKDGRQRRQRRKPPRGPRGSDGAAARKPGQDGDEEDFDDLGTVLSGISPPKVAGAGSSGAAAEAAVEANRFGDRFHRTFLQSGQLHIFHSEVLAHMVCTSFVVGLAMLQALHAYRLLSGSFAPLYAESSIADLFQAYGEPGTFRRLFAVIVAVLFWCLLSERLYGIASIANVASMTLRQRRRALRFTCANVPPLVIAPDADEQTSMRAAIAWIEEHARCSGFALELSSLRWAVVRTPVMMLYMCALQAFAGATFLSLSQRFEPLVCPGILCADPLALLAIGTALTFPLAVLIFCATQANREVRLFGDSLQESIQKVLSQPPSTEAGDEADVLYVQLRVKAAEALRQGTVCWPGGREVGCCEMVILVICAIAAAYVSILF